MDRNAFFGGSVLGVLVPPDRALDRRRRRAVRARHHARQHPLPFNELLRRHLRSGLRRHRVVLGYFLLGAMVVVPIWFYRLGARVIRNPRAATMSGPAICRVALAPMRPDRSASSGLAAHVRARRARRDRRSATRAPRGAPRRRARA